MGVHDALLFEDPVVEKADPVLAINVGNGHTMAAIISEGTIVGVMEHHTRFLNPQKIGRLLVTCMHWHDLAELEKPNIQGLRLCWIIRFEQAYRPSHFFEVWIDSHTGEVIGGTQCR